MNPESILPFHRFLIRERVWCEKCAGLRRATAVIKDEKGHELVVCDKHAGKEKESCEN